MPALAAIERFNLVNDAWAVTLAGLMPLTDYLDLTARFRGERDKNVWTILIGSLAMLNRLAPPDARPGLEALVRDRVGPALTALGWDSRAGEDELTRQLRGDLIRALGTLGNDRSVQAQAAERYGAHMHGKLAGRSQRPARPDRASSPTPATPSATTTSSSASAPRRRRRRSSAISTRWPPSRSRS